MTLSTGKLPYKIKNTRPLDPNVLPIGEWSSANRGCYARFRKWMVDTGLRPCTVQSYAIGARFVLGFLKKPYWVIEPEDDIKQVLQYLQRSFDNPSRLIHYRKGMLKFRQYLAMIQNRPEKPKAINWAYHLKGLPEDVAEAVGKYVQHCQRNWKAERSREATNTFLSHLTHPLRWMAASLSLSNMAAITPQAWYAYLDDRLSEGISPVSLNGNLRVMWGFLRFAQDQGIPICERTFKVSKLHTGPRIPKDVPIEQLRTLLAEIERTANANHKGIRRMGVMDRAWVLLMLHSGLRTGEIRTLRFHDLDLAARKLKIEQSKGLKDRFVYFSQAVCEALGVYLAVRGPRDSLPETIFVFRHQPLSRTYCGQRLHTYGKKCGVRITPHQLRHTCATLLLNERVPVISVQMLLGHQHVNTTLGYARLYDGTVAEDYFKAMDRIEGLTVAPAMEEQQVFTPGELIGLLANLKESPLNQQQKAIVSAIQGGVYALVNREHYVP